MGRQARITQKSASSSSVSCCSHSASSSARLAASCGQSVGCLGLDDDVRLEDPLLVDQARQAHDAADVGHLHGAVLVQARPVVHHRALVVEHRRPLEPLVQHQVRLREKSGQNRPFRKSLWHEPHQECDDRHSKARRAVIVVRLEPKLHWLQVDTFGILGGGLLEMPCNRGGGVAQLGTILGDMPMPS